MSIRTIFKDKTRLSLWRTLFGATLILSSYGAAFAVEVSEEAAIKAVYIFNFVSFVEWPENNNPASTIFTVCTLGEDDVTALIPGIIENEQLGQMHLEHLALSSSDELQACRILYLSTVDDETMSNIRNAVNGLPILTVSDQAGFAARGGHIEFGLLLKRVHTIINRRSIDASGLKVNAQLYRLATVVD